MSQKRVLVVIPARGGSKSIPRKNIRILAGKPLIAHTIENALKAKNITKVIVSTDDEEISNIAKFYGAEVLDRPEELCRDDTTLDPVIFHALKSMEQKDSEMYDYVVTLQPTAPLLSNNTIEKAIDTMLQNETFDTVIGAVDTTHLYWTKKDEAFVPMYKERKNRQHLDPILKETGFFISKRNFVTENSRIGGNIHLFEIPKKEAIDIDSYIDWGVAENVLNKKRIVFRVDGDKTIGMGHVYHALTLAKRIFGHDVVFLMNGSMKLGIDKVRENNFNITEFETDAEMMGKIKELHPDILINDILDTTAEYVQELKKMGIFVVNIEDLGTGTDFADVVINSLYENSNPPKHHYYGYKYVCLRDEFYIFPQKNDVAKEVKNILITFGGVDENNLTLRTLKAFERTGLKNIFVNVILGMGYQKKEELYNYVENMKKNGFNIDVRENVKVMAKEMGNADIVMTSNGRTIYEVACIGTPCISISQNEREVRHLFAHISKGIMYLGLSYNVTEENISSAIKKLSADYELRKEMNNKLLEFDLKKGIDNILNLIFSSSGEHSAGE